MTTNKLTIKGYSFHDKHCTSVSMLVEDAMPTNDEVKEVKEHVQRINRAHHGTGSISRWEIIVEPAKYDDEDGCFVS